MCRIVENRIVILLLLFTSQTYSKRPSRSGDKDIKFYEYGFHTEDESVSYIYYGVIPAFIPLYDMKIMPEQQDIDSNFTYIKVAYFNLISDVNVEYMPEKSTVSFHIKFPFIDTPIAITGYS